MISTFEAAKSVAIDDTYILGPLLILQHMFARFEIATLLDNIVRKHPQLEFNFPRIIFMLIACRFINPNSKLKVFKHWQGKLYPELLSGKDELHHFYEHWIS